MTRKIFRSILGAVIVTLLACLVIMAGILYRNSAEEQRSQLGNQLLLAAAAVEKDGLGYLDSLNLQDTRITWIAPDGTVNFDSEAAAPAMPNHADREEVQQALKLGTGQSTRYSATLLEETLYLARRLGDGSVLRLSVTTGTVFSLVLGLIQPLVLVAVISVFFSALLARRMARRIVAPFTRLNLDAPLENDTYEELAPLLKRIEYQRRQIERQLAEFTRRTEAFALITGAMKEGLILLDASRKILSINPAALELFAADANACGQDILLVERSQELQRAVQEARQHGRSQGRLLRNGREYQYDITRIEHDGQLEGLALLVFDITEQAENERRRREFSANVSHELKTPLQTIIGSAELLEHGLVASGDVSRFAGNIHKEALRLVALIEDIMHLSRLEEGMELPLSECDLPDVLAEVAQEFQELAAARGITLSVRGDAAPLHSNRPLVHEIVANLCDNAIKYNVDGGWVRLEVTASAAETTISVADSGIGIPAEEQERVFERFYRVDKSHTRSTGGTGLGLSIVKHAARRIGAEISLTSVPGRGSVFSVVFPANQSIF